MIFDPRKKIHPVVMAILVLGLLLGSGVPVVALGLEEVRTIIPSGTDAGLLSPSGLWYDGLRDLLIVSDTENNQILLVDQQGTVLKTLGRNGELYLPLAVAAGRGATLFIAERDKAVLKVLPAYNGLTRDEYQLLDLSSYGHSRPVLPVAIFAAEDGSLYVCDRGNRQLLVFDRDRKLRLAIPKTGDPADVWVQGERIYLADPGFGGVRIYNQKGRWERTLGDSVSHFPTPLRVRALVVDRRERLWVLEESGTIRALDLLGNPLLTRRPAGLFAPVDLALDQHNNLYVLERGGNRITVFHINEF